MVWIQNKVVFDEIQNLIHNKLHKDFMNKNRQKPFHTRSQLQ